jgi:hypothetical protein
MAESKTQTSDCSGDEEDDERRDEGKEDKVYKLCAE